MLHKLLLLLPITTMQFNLTKHIELKGIPSGSGIAISKGKYYVVGDDSPYLFVLDTTFELVEKIPLQDTTLLVGNRIPKPLKADYEALEMISESELVVFGSGSKSPQRDVFIRVLLTDTPTIETYNLTTFYHHLKGLEVFAGSELNIEAVAFNNEVLYLFNRNKNIVLSFIYNEFLSYLNGDSILPAIEARHITLPTIKGIEAGFSGAAILKNENKILFIASVEDTNNAYDDGEILGSLIGIIDIANRFSKGVLEHCVVPKMDKELKVESIIVVKETNADKAEIVLITDNDKGTSLILKGVLQW